MKSISVSIFLTVVLIISAFTLTAQNQPDGFYTWKNAKELWSSTIDKSNVKLNADSSAIELVDGALSGYFTINEQVTNHSFNRGLPSWNGYAPKNAVSGFKVLVKVRNSGIWSEWLTAGYWKDQIWSNYGMTTFTSGKIDIDYLVLNSFADAFQYKIIFDRANTNYSSPNINKMSMFVSDQATTNDFNLNTALADKPQAIFVPTNFVYQYSVDSEIGGSICSPTTVSMILQSFGYSVDTYQFALDTKDPHFDIFGVWPRVVQHASQYGVEGFVGRYRTWSEAAEVLKNGGRIAMSIGSPLYSGHLVMLAGFDENGNPIVHDPAKSNGYSYKHSKSDLSTAWFAKGGVAYTFYKKESANSIEQLAIQKMPLSVYPNPLVFNSVVEYELPQSADVSIKLFDAKGQLKVVLFEGFQYKGFHSQSFNQVNLENLEKGIYILNFNVNGEIRSLKIMNF